MQEVDESKYQKVEVKYTDLFELTRDCNSIVIIHIGGAGSSKSYSIAQYIIYMLVTMKNKKIVVMRKTFPALRITAMALILDLLKQYGLYKEENHNKTENKYVHGTNSILFMSLDDPEKIKSFEYNLCWMEEANEFTWADYSIIKLRRRAPTVAGEPNQLILSLNPSDATGYIAERLCGVKAGELGI